eukprot:GHVS01032057.1.p1 GENE.GHVS01032057.1~~GHVS01032057.1.p1  ORF type:complete len:625 (+),score=125.72 GHVS01032057.1:248-2122(+)
MFNTSNTMELPRSSAILPEGSASLDSCLPPASPSIGHSASSWQHQHRDYRSSVSVSSNAETGGGGGKRGLEYADDRSTVMSSWGSSSSGGLLYDSHSESPSTTTSSRYSGDMTSKPFNRSGLPSCNSFFSMFSAADNASGEDDSPQFARECSGDGVSLSSGGGEGREATAVETLKSVRKRFSHVPFSFKIALFCIVLLFVPCMVLLRSRASRHRVETNAAVQTSFARSGGASLPPPSGDKATDRSGHSTTDSYMDGGAAGGRTRDGKPCAKSVLEGVEENAGEEEGTKSLRRGLKLYEWTSATEHEVKSHRIKTFMLLFYDFSVARESFSSEAEKQHMEEMRGMLHTSAVKFASKDILHIGVPLEKLHDFQFFLGDEPEKDVPFSMIVEVKNAWTKFRLDNTPTVSINATSTTTETEQQQPPPSLASVRIGGSGTLTSAQLFAFENDYFAGYLSPWLRSELPMHGSSLSVVIAGRTARAMTQPGVVQQIVGSQFLANVIETRVDSLVFFFAPWCGHCKSFETGFAELAMKFKNIRSIDFIKIDATRNDVNHSSIRVERVPYVRFFKAVTKKRSGDEPIVFSHAETDVIKYGTAFLKEHATCPFDLVNSRDNCNYVSRQQEGVEL